MTLDEAISEFKERAEFSKKISELGMKSYIPKGKEEEQLTEWLEELKSYRASVFSGDMTQKMLKEEYCKAVDDFAEKIIRYVDCGHLCSPIEIRWSDLAVVEMVKKLAEQLKKEVGE